jgi:hypothetical protein
MRRFRRSSGRRRYRRRRSRFVRRVNRAEIINAATKKATFAQLSAENLAQGDGTGRQLIIYSPLTNLSQGDGVFQFNGRSIHPTGIQVRGNVSIPEGGAQEYTNAFIRFTLFWSRSQADYTNGQVFDSTTAASTGPTQVPPFSNPRIFDSVTTVFAPYVADDFGTQFDNTNIKVLATRIINVNPGASLNGAHPFKFFMRFPKRRLTWNDPAEQSLATPPNFPKIGNYYFIIQAFGSAGAANIATTTVAILDLHGSVYWKDISG